ncbi:MAG: hypothetical protein EU547_07520 [Promethearchaeota archaeon]|nr:MAG: hypothetical protein EU547_07520 [Candidatus Lokiarchaeota archaeon]
MVTQYSNLISFQELFSESTDHFLEPFKHIVNPDINNGMHLPFELSEKQRNKKISPILQLARPDDAKVITKIYKDIYKGTYPYREMQDVNEVKLMISDPHYEWLLFKTQNGRIAGCFTYELDFENKRGYMRGFNIKPKYQGIIDSVKAVIGSMIGIWNQYQNKIYNWYCENRTAHSKSQYLSVVCGINPIAFFPNKDIFFGKVESDIMHIIYNLKVLRSFRAKKIPLIIPAVKNCFSYATIKYNLGKIKVKNPRLKIDKKEINILQKKLDIQVNRSPFQYEKITFSLSNKSYFQFLFTPQVNNFEKVHYHVNNINELYLYLKHFKRIIDNWNIRYAECFVSAYKPIFQKLFYRMGFQPRGYVPSWKYDNQNKSFNDSIVFNWFKKPLGSKPKLIIEGQELLKYIEL